jgi:hypothetical protein
MGAPPDTGLEQHLRRNRPQEPGGCVEDRLRFIVRSWAMYLLVELAQQSFLGQV